MKSVTYSVPNISCKHCTHTITMELSELEGVSKSRCRCANPACTITFDDPATEQQLKDTLAEINYPAVE
jgi:copper chaperone